MKANTKKNSTTKKLVPAAGSLLISAAMLGTSTYAWFTMSREVEVTNISMVATTPEDIQISLGLLGTGTTAETSGKGVSLAASTGVLIPASGKANASNGQVAAPEHSWDWSNTADFSAYYEIGKLIPASSTTGANIFFTPDANGVGKTVRSDAKYYQANGANVNDASGAAMTGSGANGYAKATLHAKTAPDDAWASTSGSSTNGKGGYTKSTAWNYTNDDGYYVDIPIWLRTSSTETTSLTVKAYVAPKTESQKSNSNNEALYKAVRVALLPAPAGEQGSGAVPSATNLLPLKDGLTGMTSGTSGTLATNPFGGESVLDWYNGTYNSGAVASVTGTSGTYAAATQYTATSFVTLTSGTGGQYGAATKVIVRVWLEGNDPDCWNETAGQDWYINLKFGKAGDMDDKNIAGAAKNGGGVY